MSYGRSVRVLGTLLVFLLTGVAAPAQADKEPDQESQASGPPPTPPAIEVTVPIEFDFDYGASNGKAFINRYAPLLAVPLGRQWKLINLTLAIVARAPGGVPGRPGNPDPVPGEETFGLSDLTNAVFFTPPATERLVWGFGPIVTFPIATDPALGSQKWSAGPAFRIAYRPGPWNLGSGRRQFAFFCRKRRAGPGSPVADPGPHPPSTREGVVLHEQPDHHRKLERIRPEVAAAGGWRNRQAIRAWLNADESGCPRLLQRSQTRGGAEQHVATGSGTSAASRPEAVIH